MAYRKDVNPNGIDIGVVDTLRILDELGFTYERYADEDNEGHIWNNVSQILAAPTTTVPDYEATAIRNFTTGLNNINLKKEGTAANTWLLNTGWNKYTYNLNDIVAVAKRAEISDEDIKNAFQTVGVKPPSSSSGWTVDDIKKIRQTATPVAEKITDFLNQHGFANNNVVTMLNDDGDGYIYKLAYTDSKGLTQYVDIPEPEYGKYNDAALSKIFADHTELGVVANTPVFEDKTSNILENAQADYDLAKTVLNRLDAGGLKNANAFNNLSEEDRKAITAALPSTDNLTAWNQTKDTPVFENLIANLKQTDPELLKRIDYDTLKNISETITDEQQSITERNIKNQQSQLLQQIQNDPALYESLVKQARSDNAAGTIAGQRAANTQQIVNQSDAGYDEQAAKLYEKLFSGEKNIAQATYDTNYGNAVNTLDTIVQGKLDDAVAKENLRASQISEINTMLQALSDATGIDVARFADAISENQAEAGEKSSSLVSKVQGDLTKALSDNRANIDKISALFGEGASYLNQAKDGSTTVTSAVDKINEELAKSVKSGNYGFVTAGDYEKAKQLANKQYNDLVVENPEFIKWILDSDTIDAYTKKQTIDEFIKSNELDMLTLDGLTKYYNDFNEEATKQSNKVFNQAQRAYIAAITAGDVKTAEQLTRLATSANTSKNNLYAASALANQFKQQFGLNNTGRQLTTDFQNQQSYNRGNVAQSQYDAAAAQLKYLGSGNQQSNGATLYEAYNKHFNNAATGTDAYGKFGSNVMGRNQDMNSWIVKNNIDNWNRLVDVANAYTNANAAGAAANNEAQGSIETLQAQAKAKQQQALKLNPNLKQ